MLCFCGCESECLVCVPVTSNQLLVNSCARFEGTEPSRPPGFHQHKLPPLPPLLQLTHDPTQHPLNLPCSSLFLEQNQNKEQSQNLLF